MARSRARTSRHPVGFRLGFYRRTCDRPVSDPTRKGSLVTTTRGTLTISDALKSALAPDYEVVRPLGEGAMGRVFLGLDSALKRPVAIKVLRPELASDTTARRRFQREARSTAKLSHPNIATIYRVGEADDGTPYLVMEYVKGRNLKDNLAAQGALNQDTALEVIGQLASALAAAHAAGIIHRDVKPANVIWDPEDNRAVLTDFGIARVLEESGEAVTRLTQVGHVLGDLAAMSPEQLRGESLTQATDLYSLGVLAFKILTGEGPYPATSAAELAHAHLRQPPRRLRDLNPGVDPRTSALLERCLSKKPQHRPRAVDVAEEISAIRATPVEERGSTSLSDATEGLPALQGFLSELKRRRVYNVIVVYGALAFLVLQVAELTVPELPLPSWSYTAVVAAVLAGFPIAVVLGWMFDVTSSGLRRAAPAEGRSSRRHLLYQGVGLALSLILALAIGFWILGT